MDPQTFATLSAILLLLGNVAQFLFRVLGNAPAPGQLNPEACVRLIKGEVAIHEVHCTNVEKAVAPILEQLGRIEHTLNEHIQFHMQHP